MRRCRIDLPNRCYHLISRVAHRALEFGGLQAANRKGRYDKEKLLWQFTVAIKFDPVGSGEPDAETVEQALAYRKALARRPDWNHPISVAVVEVCGNAGYNWFDLS